MTCIAGPSRLARSLISFGNDLRPCNGPARRCLKTSKTEHPSRLAFAFDIDGVLKRGNHVLPEAKRVLQLLSGHTSRFPRPVPFLMMTNGGGVPEINRQQALGRDFGIDVGPNQLVQSHTPLQDYVHDYADKPVLIVGGVGDAGRKVAESYGLERAYILQDLIAWRPSIWDRYTLSTEEETFVKRDVDFSDISIEAIFVIHDNGMDWGLATQVITELLSTQNGVLGTQRSRMFGEKDGKDIPLVLTNPDVLWGSDYPLPRLGMGAFRLALEEVYKATTGVDLQYTQFGKPYKSTFAFAEKMLRKHMKSLGGDSETPLDVYMVGDNPESDIAGANAHGWTSILVKTGVFRGGQPSHVPTKIVENVEEGVHWAIQRELDGGQAWNA